MIVVESRKKSRKTLDKKYPNYLIIDVTSKGEEPWVKLSPFYPHGKIPVPFSSNYTSLSVEGIWQGLKVFAGQDVDPSKFEINNMKGLKRTVRKFGKPVGHRKGITGSEILNYIDARKEIYLVAYDWMLNNKAQEILQLLKEMGEANNIVLLDYTTNGNIIDSKKPLSHASLVKSYLERKYPEIFLKEPSIVPVENSVSNKGPKKGKREKNTIKKSKTNKLETRQNKDESSQLKIFK